MKYSEAVASGEFETYVQSICALTGDRNPIEVMSKTPDAIRHATQDLADKVIQQPEQEGKWSVLQVVRHLGDAEIAIGFRFRKIMAEPGCNLSAIDQDAWSNTFQYNTGTLHQAIDDFEAVRKVNVRLLQNTDPSLFERFGFHEERGEESAARTLALYAGHDLYHLAQIERIKDAVLHYSANTQVRRVRVQKTREQAGLFLNK